MSPFVRRLVQLVVLALSLGVALVLAEQVWRALVRARYDADRAEFAARAAAGAPELALFELADGDRLYGLRRGLDRTETIADPAGGPATTVRYRVRDDGLRAQPGGPLPPAEPGTRRLLFVGDSYTFGSAVDDGVAFPHHAETALRARGVPAVAINAGVPGYNSGQVLAWLGELLPRHRPDHVVYGFVMNDAEPPIGVRTPLADVYGDTWSWLWLDAAQLVDTLLVALVDDTPWRTRGRPQYELDYRRSWRGGAAKGDTSLAAIDTMQRVCREHAAGFTVAIVPDFAQRLDDTYPYLAVHDRVAAHCRAHGIDVVDLLAGLRGADVVPLRVAGDLHPNAAGQRRLGEQLAAHLAERFRG